MIEGIGKASNRALVKRTGVGLGKGSHSPFQRLTEPVIRSVPNADERMGFVQGGVLTCLQAGGVSEVYPASRCSCPVRKPAGGVSLLSASRQKKTLCPPTLPCTYGGLASIFPGYFSQFVNLPVERNE